ncbi:uncharacterized protein EV420DRAFT_1481189 [Desarmillaria tabescens]|uniref:Uncharacterized protein n=1 Tax=Armillaria tabescens TaxID=1929756 RepID=A0AA39N381_ARMTA|nr:uncharacterized protein EV420DRAFT_1481189 [Desarmillaria tabescens]KAK0455749.1 hypothetical protein EV420DRAFT_1481189 [Desarmillaria tabescens]
MLRNSKQKDAEEKTQLISLKGQCPRKRQRWPESLITTILGAGGFRGGPRGLSADHFRFRLDNESDCADANFPVTQAERDELLIRTPENLRAVGILYGPECQTSDDCFNDPLPCRLGSTLMAAEAPDELQEQNCFVDLVAELVWFTDCKRLHNAPDAFLNRGRDFDESWCIPPKRLRTSLKETMSSSCSDLRKKERLKISVRGDPNDWKRTSTLPMISSYHDVHAHVVVIVGHGLTRVYKTTSTANYWYTSLTINGPADDPVVGGIGRTLVGMVGRREEREGEEERDLMCLYRDGGTNDAWDGAQYDVSRIIVVDVTLAVVVRGRAAT